MTTTTNTPSAIPEITADERADRITKAGTAWSERIDADRSSSQLSYAVEGAGVGSVATTVRAGFSEVRLDIKLTGPESDERYDELRKTVDARCPVLDIFQNPTPVKTTVSRA